MKAKKDELTAQWPGLSGSLPKSMEEITTKVAALTKTHKLLAGAGEQLDPAKQLWTAASSALSSGNLSDAMAKANKVKDKLAALRTTLEMKPAAWTTTVYASLKATIS